MKSIDRLIAEHDLIERGLVVLEKAAGRISSGQSVPDDFLKWAPDFFAQFADKCHHAKEEDLFFPLLKRRGIPEDGGPIGVMLYEHEVGRDCVRRMRTASDADNIDRPAFATAAQQFVPLLRQHILKENTILFRMAENLMSEADDADMNCRFSQVETDRDLGELHDRYERDVVRWEEQIT